MLLAIRAVRRDGTKRPSDLVQPLALFAYAAAFSYAYLSLSAGTGALILFGCVQATILAGALRAGERFRAAEAMGLALALGGLGVLVAPGLAAPSLLGSVLMAIAGIAWGVYTLRGRGSTDALGDTMRNFTRAVVPALLLGVLAIRHAHMDARGALLAAVSGAITSGLGYLLWFAALRGMTAIQAAIVQLAVPALAATGGVALLGERITWRLVVAAALILGGVGLAIALRSTRMPRRR
jgi:drug/metabolite transporter (DMT)-like permease